MERKNKKITIIILVIILILLAVGITLLIVLPKKHNHSYGAWTITKVATCTETGQRERKCSSCDNVEIEIIEKLPHTPGSTVYKTPGTHYQVCEVCGTHVNESEHTFNTENKCTVCDYELEFTKNLRYSLSNGTYTVTSLADVENGTTKLIIPAYYEGVKVTGIASNIATTNTTVALGIEYVCIPNTFTKINSSSLRSFAGLTNIYLPESITVIEDSAFENCSSLKTISLPKSLTIIGNRTFFGCNSLSEITIPNSVTKIGTSAFQACVNLKKVTLPNNITEILEDTFRGCKNLNSIIVPASVTAIKDGAFVDCQIIEVRNLSATLRIEAGRSDYGAIGFNALGVINNNSDPSNIIETAFGFVFYELNDEYLLINYNGTERNITLPDNINGKGYSIHKYAFYEKNISSVTINSEIKEIQESAFYNCKSLITLIIDGAKNIQNNAFVGCGNLKTVVLCDSVQSINGTAFNSSRATYYLEFEEIPESWSANWNNGNTNIFLNGEWEFVNGIPTKI